MEYICLEETVDNVQVFTFSKKNERMMIKRERKQKSEKDERKNE